MGRKVDIVTCANGSKIVVINDIIFKGKRRINWDDVEEYLKRYIGTCHEVIENADKIYIDKDFPDEYAGSKDTAKLMEMVRNTCMIY